jgi:hypothetical protein
VRIAGNSTEIQMILADKIPQPVRSMAFEYQHLHTQYYTELRMSIVAIVP